MTTTVEEAIGLLERVYHSDLAQRSRIIGMLVRANIIDKPIPVHDPKAPCPPLKEIKAIKVSFFDNGQTAIGYRGAPSPIKREFGIALHAWTGNAAKVRSDRHANWTATVPLWDADFADTHIQTLRSKKQVCQETVDLLTSAIAQTDRDCLYGLAFSRSKGGSGWLRKHVIVARLENRKPRRLLFIWGDDALEAEEFSDRGVDGKRLKNGNRPIVHARIAFNDEHADWCTDARY